jgi:hypothetical protein
MKNDQDHHEWQEDEQRGQASQRWNHLAQFMFLPPLLFFAGAILLAGLNYDGMCPGLLNGSPYPCSLSEFIGRYAFDPEPFTVLLLLSAGWLIFAALVFLLWRLIQRWLGKEEN